MKSKTYCFVAGVSGGHILPALNIAHDYQTQDPNARLMIITTTNDLDLNIMKTHVGMEHVPIKLNPVPYRAWYKLPLFAYQLCTALFKSVLIFIKSKPEKVITTGSHIALPVCFVAWVLRIPIELIALDVEPGKTLLALAPLATNVFICFAETQQYFPRNHCTIRSYPLSTITRSLNSTREQIIQELGFDPDKKTILIVGGSQGSVSLNNAIKSLIEAHPEIACTLQFIHQTGSFDDTNWQSLYSAHGITAYAFAYNPELVRYYSAADCIITRAGSGSLHEILHLNKQCIIVPLITHTTHHQRANAHAMLHRHPNLVQVIEQNALNNNDRLLRGIITSIK